MATTKVIRWIARVWTVLSVGLVLTIFVGESMADPPNLGDIAPRDWIQMLFFPVGICVGLVIGLWRERLGGGIAVGALIAFYALNTAFTGHIPDGPWFALVAGPGFLYLWCAGRTEREASGESTG